MKNLLNLCGCIFGKYNFILIYVVLGNSLYSLDSLESCKCPPFHPPPYRFLTIMMFISLDTSPDGWHKSFYSSLVFTPVRKPTVFHQYGFIICRIHCSHYTGWRRKKMGSLDLNVVLCFAKSYFTQIEFAV